MVDLRDGEAVGVLVVGFIISGGEEGLVHEMHSPDRFGEFVRVEEYVHAFDGVQIALDVSVFDKPVDG